MKFASLRLCLFLICATAALSQTAPGSQSALPYSPSLDLDSMDRSVDPCVDLYHYSCGGWQKKSPIPPDQTSWSVYGKLYVDNLNFLRTILEQASASNKLRNPVTQKSVTSTAHAWMRAARRNVACPDFSRRWMTYDD
jgi:putative endopeptidase